MAKIHRRVLAGLAFVIAAGCGGGGGAGFPPGPPGTVSGSVIVARLSSVGVTGREQGRRSSVPGPALVPDQILVKIRPGVSSLQAQNLHSQLGGTLKATIPQLGVHVVQVEATSEMIMILNRYRQSAQVLYAEQDRYAYKAALPNDPIYGNQWHYARINLPTAWDSTIGAPSVIVAVVDDGIAAHPDLISATVPGHDFNSFPADNDPTWPGCPSNPASFSHGTHVAGTIAAVTNNAVGVAGVNWGGSGGTKVMAFRTFGPCPADGAPMSANATAIAFAADKGAKIINMSWGGGFTQALKDAIDYAYAKGVTLVAAAGNNYPDPIPFPAAFPNVIAVGATNCADNVTSYSQAGPELDIMAPGGSALTECGFDGASPGDEVWSTSASLSAGNSYFRSRGTSMAAPHIAGIAALLISRGIIGPANIQNRLQSTAIDRGPIGWDPDYGWGLANAAAAVASGNTASSLSAFSGEISGSTITRQSNLVLVNSNGSFIVTNAANGTKSVFAWQDFNGNGLVDSGDMYGRVDGIVITAGGNTTGITITVQLYTGSPITVASGP